MRTIKFSGAVASTICAALTALACVSAFAQAYPNKPIELVVTTSAGSGGDVVSRTVAEIIRREKFLPQLLTVNNRVGGASVIGYVLADKVLNLPFAINPWIWLAGLLVGSAGVTAAGLLGTAKVLRTPPMQVFRVTS